MQHPENIHWGRSLATTGLMILFVVAASFGVIHRINRMEEEKGFERLYEEAASLADDIAMYVKSDREELEMIAALIANYPEPDSPELWKILDSYTAEGMMSRIELLLPDDTVLTGSGQRTDAGGVLSFEKEAALGAHVTDRETDLRDDGNYIVRHYVPVRRDGQTAAMLYGVVELETLPEKANMDPYGGKGALYIIDGNNGDFLVDTWHQGETGNMWELGEREMAPGYDSGQLRQGILDGDSRYVVFVSRTIGEYLYFYYTPLGINQWRVAVSVPESVVFESAHAIQRLLNLFLAFEMVCFVIYFLWMIRYARRVTAEKQRRLDTVRYIYDVEKLLFNAHEKKENIGRALEKIGDVLSAEQVSFWISGASSDREVFCWRRPGAESYLEAAGKGDAADRLLRYFQEGNGQLEMYERQELQKILPENGQEGIRNMTAVPVEDMEGNICGILAGYNISGGSASAALLRNMKFSFAMFCRNLKIYTDIRKRGERDVLTGLYNRNRYEDDLAGIGRDHPAGLSCIYIDVNGLHEMNNANGHEKGDLMLRTVAEKIGGFFCTKYSYRIGGDEFVVFVPEKREADVLKQCGEFDASLERMGYHVSVGIQWEAEVSSMNVLIKAAEKKMYEEKKRYYAQAAHDRRQR